VTCSDKQTGTLHSESPTPSEEGRHDPEVGLDRQRIDRDKARRRFDRAVVDARDVDFSDKIGADRKSYKVRSRRRRHRQRTTSETDGSNDSEDESMPSRLARLRREAEELRIELEQRDDEDNAADSAGLDDGFAKLNMTLDRLQAPQRHQKDGQLLSEKQTHNNQQPDTQALPPETSPSAVAAISSFSDRLTSLESALGLATTLPTASSSHTSILPTLAHLSTQINTLTSTLTPTQTHGSSLPTLDSLATRVRTLSSETTALTQSRRLALDSLTSLTEARLRSTAAPYGHTRGQSQQQSAASAALTTSARQQESTLFLSEQSAKISALYELLPTIQSLHPLLPSVLDRLRSLQIVHAGAADARGDLEEVERRQEKTEAEIKRWREGLEGVERGIREAEVVGRGNLEVVREMVGGLEGRLREALK
jgi:nuclear migration protein JNM1